MSKSEGKPKKSKKKEEEPPKPLHVLCIISTTREGKIANRIAKLVEHQFDEHLKPKNKNHSFEIIDPEHYNLPLLKQPLHFYQDPSKIPEKLNSLNSKIAGADAYIILLAEYNRTLPPALTNLLDHLPPSSFEYKPSGLVGYSIGPHGAAVACAAARPFLSELGCLPVKHVATVGQAHQEVNEDGSTENEYIISNIRKVLDQLEWWGRAAKNLRYAEGIPKQNEEDAQQ